MEQITGEYTGTWQMQSIYGSIEFSWGNFSWKPYFFRQKVGGSAICPSSFKPIHSQMALPWFNRYLHGISDLIQLCQYTGCFIRIPTIDHGNPQEAKNNLHTPMRWLINNEQSMNISTNDCSLSIMIGLCMGKIAKWVSNPGLQWQTKIWIMWSIMPQWKKACETMKYKLI